MKIIEIFANRRSGHHFFMSWLISNISGIKDNKIKNLNKITWITEDICHYNDATYHAFFNKKQVEKEIQEIIDKKPKYLFINYEESDVYNQLNNKEGILNKYDTTKIIYLRDFFNTMASKWAVSNTDLKEFYFGFENKEQIIENIDTWKMMSKNFLNDKFIGFKYEYLLSDNLEREMFLQQTFNVKEKFKPTDFDGTKSSFKTKNYNKRYDEVDFSNTFKDLVISDTMLYYLIGATKYEYKILN